MKTLNELLILIEKPYSIYIERGIMIKKIEILSSPFIK